MCMSTQLLALCIVWSGCHYHSFVSMRDEMAWPRPFYTKQSCLNRVFNTLSLSCSPTSIESPQLCPIALFAMPCSVTKKGIKLVNLVTNGYWLITYLLLLLYCKTYSIFNSITLWNLLEKELPPSTLLLL